MPDLGRTTLLNSETLTLTLTRSPNSPLKPHPPSLTPFETLNSAYLIRPQPPPGSNPAGPVGPCEIKPTEMTAAENISSSIDGGRKVLEDFLIRPDLPPDSNPPGPKIRRCKIKPTEMSGENISSRIDGDRKVFEDRVTRPKLVPDSFPDVLIGPCEIKPTEMSGVNISSSIDGGRKVLEDYVAEWKARRVDSGVAENRCFLPFLAGAPSLAQCRACSSYIYPGDEVFCSVQSCKGVYHLKCIKDDVKCSKLKKFKCPQHACYICKQKCFWRCVRCDVASHDKCAAWPDEVIHLSERPGWAVCWRHEKDWRQGKHESSSTDAFEDIFAHLPLPYVEEEFQIESTLKDFSNDNLSTPPRFKEDIFSRLPLPHAVEEFSIDSTLIDDAHCKMEPPPYVHIRRNIYLAKKKRDVACVDIGCTCHSSTCSKDCLCWVQSISCSRACRCSEACTNRPFRKEKKLKIVKTDHCGWGVEAAEPLNKDDFVIEYVGEVVDDVECTKRLWDMKNKDVKNFYMCEIQKDFTIDATFKGNASRFLNHCCEPNCKMEKWQVEGETRVGVFAARTIEVGEPLTYDYRFVQFGPEVQCHCGAANCQGYLGAKRKIHIDVLDMKRRMQLASLSWGSKRRRATVSCRTVVRVQVGRLHYSQ